jgi:arginine decarboxylase
LYVPTKIFFTKGVGRHKDYLSFFESALRNAGIEICNLVTVSSVLPPGCKRISRDEGLKELKPGQITFTVMARTSINER